VLKLNILIASVQNMLRFF